MAGLPTPCLHLRRRSPGSFPEQRLVIKNRPKEVTGRRGERQGCQVCVSCTTIRELKQQQRRRRRGRRLVKNEIIIYKRISRLSRYVRYAYGLKVAKTKYAMTAFNSKRKHENSAAVVRVPKTTKNLVISRCCFAEDSKEMYKDL